MAKKLGNQNPTQSVILPFKKSKYKEAVSLYEKSKRKAQKWQIGLLKSMLAVNKDGLWVHTKYGYSVPRRNGKNEVVAIRELYALHAGEQVLHTAHRTNTSHTAWERLVKIVEGSGYERDVDFITLKAKGNERIEFLESGGRVEFRTRTTTGGLGEGFDLLVIDEAQEYEDGQETALKYVVSSSQNPQTIFLGTPPTPVSSGTVFTKYRDTTLSGKTKNGAWAEWSVEDQSDINDIDLWYQTNPSLGTILSERKIEDEIGEDEIDFNIQRLGLWIKYNLKSAISEKEWDILKITKLPEFKGELFAGIKFGRDGANAALSIAVKTTENKIFVESIDCKSVRFGNQWILDFINKIDCAAVVVDGASGQDLITQEFKERKMKLKPIIPTVKEIINANSLFEKGVYNQTLQHNNQESLKLIVTNADKRFIGTNGGFGYKSLYEDYDVALMDSVILAHWICFETKEKPKQRVRY